MDNFLRFGPPVSHLVGVFEPGEQFLCSKAQAEQIRNEHFKVTITPCTLFVTNGINKEDYVEEIAKVQVLCYNGERPGIFNWAIRASKVVEAIGENHAVLFTHGHKTSQATAKGAVANLSRFLDLKKYQTTSCVVFEHDTHDAYYAYALRVVDRDSDHRDERAPK